MNARNIEALTSHIKDAAMLTGAKEVLVRDAAKLARFLADRGVLDRNAVEPAGDVEFRLEDADCCGADFCDVGCWTCGTKEYPYQSMPLGGGDPLECIEAARRHLTLNPGHDVELKFDGKWKAFVRGNLISNPTARSWPDTQPIAKGDTDGG